MKIGLVVEGGGMKCAYASGILDAFLDEKITFSYCIGVSSGSAITASFVAGQRDRNLRFFTVHTRDPRFYGISNFLRTRNFFGLRYIYGDLTNAGGGDPLDYRAMLRNPAEYRLVATNAETGQAEYFRKEDMRQDDYRLVMASSAIPVVCEPIAVDGKFYYDGGISDGVPYMRALEEGCDKVVVLLSKPRGFVRPPQKFRWCYARALKKFPKVVEAIDRRHEVYNACLNRLWELEKAGRAFVFAPDGAIKISKLRVVEKLEYGLYDAGMRDFAAQKEALRAFMEN